MLSTLEDGLTATPVHGFVVPEIHTPITDKMFEDAYCQSDCYGGEGWGEFACRIQRNVEEWELLIREARDHIQQYDDGMADWLDRTADFEA